MSAGPALPMLTGTVDQFLDEVQLELGVDTRCELARLLGVTQGCVANWKRREGIPISGRNRINRLVLQHREDRRTAPVDDSRIVAANRTLDELIRMARPTLEADSELSFVLLPKHMTANDGVTVWSAALKCLADGSLLVCVPVDMTGEGNWQSFRVVGQQVRIFIDVLNRAETDRRAKTEQVSE